GLFYWNEGATTSKLIAAIKDMNQNDTTDFLHVDAGNWPFGLYAGQSLTSFPSAGVDANNSIYLGYSSIAEGTSNINSKAYRHQYVMRSDDQGATWWPSLDVT